MCCTDQGLAPMAPIHHRDGLDKPGVGQVLKPNVGLCISLAVVMGVYMSLAGLCAGARGKCRLQRSQPCRGS